MQVNKLARGESLALVGATVITGLDARPLSDAVVLIESGRIVAVGPRAHTRIPDGVERRNVAGLTVLPGLIDSHVHISFALVRGPNDPQADATINQVLLEFLHHGVTTIRDVGAGHPWILEVARSIREGRREGPRLLAAGPMLTGSDRALRLYADPDPAHRGDRAGADRRGSDVGRHGADDYLGR